MGRPEREDGKQGWAADIQWWCGLTEHDEVQFFLAGELRWGFLQLDMDGKGAEALPTGLSVEMGHQRRQR
jgi:hypothetical protein